MFKEKITNIPKFGNNLIENSHKKTKLFTIVINFIDRLEPSMKLLFDL